MGIMRDKPINIWNYSHHSQQHQETKGTNNVKSFIVHSNLKAYQAPLKMLVLGLWGKHF